MDIPEPDDLYPPRPGKPEYSGSTSRYKADDQGVARLCSNGNYGESLYDGTQQYHQAVIGIDENVGRLIRTLKSTGQLENTLVVYTADQGFAWGQHGFRHKLAPYAANIRVPFIVSMPGTVTEGEVCTSPVGGIDLIPTFYKFAGIDLPWNMHGRDLTPLFRRPNRKWEHPVFLTYTARSYRPDTHTIQKKEELPGQVPWYGFVIKDRLKYIQTFIEGEIPELYHIDNDPHELHNLALMPQYRTQVNKHQKLLVSELKRTNAQFVDSLPSVKGF